MYNMNLGSFKSDGEAVLIQLRTAIATPTDMRNDSTAVQDGGLHFEMRDQKGVGIIVDWDGQRRWAYVKGQGRLGSGERDGRGHCRWRGSGEQRPRTRNQMQPGWWPGACHEGAAGNERMEE